MGDYWAVGSPVGQVLETQRFGDIEVLLWSTSLGATEPREALGPQLCTGTERVACPWTVPPFAPEVHKSCCGVERDAASLLAAAVRLGQDT